MRPQESPFPLGWWGTSLEDVGLEQRRPPVGTYGCFDFLQLPSLPFRLSGTFDWLDNSGIFSGHIGAERSAKNLESFLRLSKAMARNDLLLPNDFVTFVNEPSLREHIRSNTDCFLDIGEEATISPAGNGHLVRFLADSQGCVFWYLYLQDRGLDQAVVASSDFYGSEAEKWNDAEPDPARIVYCAESFEAFLCRFWLENEIWFSAYEATPLPRGGEAYIEAYKKGAGR